MTMLMVTYAVMGIGMSMAMPGLNAAASLAVDGHEQGAVAGLLSAAPTAGMIFGPAVGAAMYSVSIDLPMYVGGALTAIVGVYFLFLKVPDPK